MKAGAVPRIEPARSTAEATRNPVVRGREHPRNRQFQDACCCVIFFWWGEGVGVVVTIQKLSMPSAMKLQPAEAKDLLMQTPEAYFLKSYLVVVTVEWVTFSFFGESLTPI